MRIHSASNSRFEEHIIYFKFIKLRKMLINSHFPKIFIYFFNFQNYFVFFFTYFLFIYTYMVLVTIYSNEKQKNACIIISLCTLGKS